MGLHGIKTKKILNLNRKKWEYIKNFVLKQSNTNKRSCSYKFYDSNSYSVSKFTNRFSNNYKQKLKTLYGGLLNKFLKKSVRSSLSGSSLTKLRVSKKIIFLNSLEKRLDVVLVRTHFASSMRAARQLISHGKVLVNEKVQMKKSFLLNKGDKLTFKESAKNIINFNLIYSTLWPIPPKYLEINYKIFSIVVIDEIIFLNNFYLNLNPNIILENYKNK